jgi:hypothetical protein
MMRAAFSVEKMLLPEQACQMVYFQTKNPNLGKFWRSLCRLENIIIFYGNSEYFMAMCYILRPFDNLLVVWYIFHRFGVVRQEKSGNPVPEWSRVETFR